MNNDLRIVLYLQFTRYIYNWHDSILIFPSIKFNKFTNFIKHYLNVKFEYLKIT